MDNSWPAMIKSTRHNDPKKVAETYFANSNHIWLKQKGGVLHFTPLNRSLNLSNIRRIQRSDPAWVREFLTHLEKLQAAGEEDTCPDSVCEQYWQNFLQAYWTGDIPEAARIFYESGNRFITVRNVMGSLIFRPTEDCSPPYLRVGNQDWIHQFQALIDTHMEKEKNMTSDREVVLDDIETLEENETRHLITLYLGNEPKYRIGVMSSYKYGEQIKTFVIEKNDGLDMTGTIRWEWTIEAEHVVKLFESWLMGLRNDMNIPRLVDSGNPNGDVTYKLAP